MTQMFVFPTPADAHCELLCDALGPAVVIVAQSATHPSGRAGQAFAVPDGVTGGVQRTISSPTYVTSLERGVFTIGADGLGYFQSDDVHLTVEKVCPDPPPVQPIPLPTPKTPLDLINQVYATGKYDLSTLDGCGKFTEACVDALHSQFSQWYGHIKKTPPQTMYNGHAVDALMLLFDTPTAKAGIYDIIVAKASTSARPAFNFSGAPDTSLWYYPA